MVTSAHGLGSLSYSFLEQDLYPQKTALWGESLLWHQSEAFMSRYPEVSSNQYWTDAIPLLAYKKRQTTSSPYYQVFKEGRE